MSDRCRLSLQEGKNSEGETPGLPTSFSDRERTGRRWPSPTRMPESSGRCSQRTRRSTIPQAAMTRNRPDREAEKIQEIRDTLRNRSRPQINERIMYRIHPPECIEGKTHDDGPVGPALSTPELSKGF